MESYQRQKRVGSTIFRAKNVKEAMGAARLAFGVDADVVSVEKVGGIYCVEVMPPSLPAAQSEVLAQAQRWAPPARPAPWSEAEPSMAAARPVPLQDPLEEIARVERRFEELAARMPPASGHQGAGLAGMSGIRDTLSRCGFGEPFVGKLSGAMIDAGAVAFDKVLAMRIVSSWLGQLGEAPDLETGWQALVGPAGSGKTTTIAKLASRAAGKHGPEAVGLVTTDFFRIGAYEQLRMFGELLGIAVHPARSLQELESLRIRLAAKKVVYVDTVGSSRDDDRMREQMRMFATLGIGSTMAVQACLSRAVMRVDVGRWKEAGAGSALITKLDQAIGIASVVETLIMRGVPVAYAATGQQVPADLHKVTPLLLAHKALRGEPEA